MDAARPILLVFPFGYLSHYLRCLVLCKYLKDSFEILFAYHEQYSAFVEDEGFASFKVATLDEAGVLTGVKKFDFSWLNEQGLEKCFRSQVSAIERYQPLAVIGDATPTLKMAADYSGIRFVALLNGYMSKYYADARILSKKHPAFPYMAWLPSAINKRLTRHGEAVSLRRVHRPFRKLRAAYRLKSQRTYLDELEGDITLICDLPRIFPQKDQPGHYTSIGPLIYDEPSSPAISGRLTPGKKTIFISMGSTGDWTAVSFLNQAHYSRYNIVTAGDSHAVLNAPHIISTAFVAGSDLLPHTDLVICHGGNGTIYQSLAYGIPLLCSPAHFEQEWNLAALEKAGLAGSLEMTGNDSYYRKTVDRWINKKASAKYSSVQREIQEARITMASKLKELSSDLIAGAAGHQALTTTKRSSLV